MSKPTNMTVSGAQKIWKWSNLHNFLANIRDRLYTCGHNDLDVCILHAERKHGNGEYLDIEYYYHFVLNSLFMSVKFSDNYDTKEANSRLFRIFELCMQVKRTVGISIIIGVADYKVRHPYSCGFMGLGYVDGNYCTDFHLYTWEFYCGRQFDMPSSAMHWLYRIERKHFKFNLELQ